VRVVYDEDALRVGSRVRHGTFGVGTVKGLEGAGEQQKVTVVFTSVGAKKLPPEVRRPRAGVNEEGALNTRRRRRTSPGTDPVRAG
jgi:hypothetical protein